MREEVELLLEMYKSQVARSEHFETQRTTLTNVVLTLASALLALTAMDDRLTPPDAWLGASLVVLGAFGFLGSVFHARRAERHGDRAEAYRNAMDTLAPGAGINAVRGTVAAKRTYLNWIWSAIHGVIGLAGALVIWLSLTQA
jgi:hypothetical protein